MRHIKARIDGKEEVVHLIRVGPRNSRIERTIDGETKSVLISNEDICWTPVKTSNLPERIIPVTPLRRLYSNLRKTSGGRNAHFAKLKELLERVGIGPGFFIAELFKRSVAQFNNYRNDEEFTPAVNQRTNTFVRRGFATRLITAFRDGQVDFTNCEDLAADYVDYEVSSIRTTSSCFEDASMGTDSGKGGMDFLLYGKQHSKPIVAEVKANTETVGPTFALIQGLMYLSELAAAHQATRLKNTYTPFSKWDMKSLDLYLIFEEREPGAPNDLAFMRDLAEKFLQVEGISLMVGKIACLYGIENDKIVEFRRMCCFPKDA